MILAQPLGAAAQQERPALVRVDLVQMVDVDETAPVLGRLVTRQSATITARVAGPVQMVKVNVGDIVAEGDELAQIDATRMAIALQLREADLEQARANVDVVDAGRRLASQVLDRLISLQGSAAFSAARYEDALLELARTEHGLSEAQARLLRSEAEVELARVDLADATVRAPFAGVVVERQAQPGAYLAIGGSVVTLLDVDSLEIEADVPVDRISGLTPGREVAARLADGRGFTVVVRAIVPNENPLTRTRAVRFDKGDDNGFSDLAENQSITVNVPLGEQRQALTVHKDAVITGPRGTIVYVVTEDAADMRPVRLGTAIGDRFEVLSGLADGDVVVTRGNERLRPGQPLQIVGETPQEQPT
ncbi:MAG: efflux RND transporter periplasmic adaptor subunit [Pseudomonadota bacterium]